MIESAIAELKSALETDDMKSVTVYKKAQALLEALERAKVGEVMLVASYTNGHDEKTVYIDFIAKDVAKVNPPSNDNDKYKGTLWFSPNESEG